MIRIPQPSMALNAPDSPYVFRMHVTYSVPATEAIDITLRRVRQAALRQPDRKLRCLIINGHGVYGGIGEAATGGYGTGLGTGITARNVHHFGLLRDTTANPRPLVDHIFVTSCGAADVSEVDAEGDGNGVLLCRSMAKYSGANVTAANIEQLCGSGWETPCYIDGFEGLTRQWDPNGNVTFEYEYLRWPFHTQLYGLN
jgi:hypothetical protein